MSVEWQRKTPVPLSEWTDGRIYPLEYIFCFAIGGARRSSPVISHTMAGRKGGARGTFTERCQFQLEFMVNMGRAW